VQHSAVTILWLHLLVVANLSLFAVDGVVYITLAAAFEDPAHCWHSIVAGLSLPLALVFVPLNQMTCLDTPARCQTPKLTTSPMIVASLADCETQGFEIVEMTWGG
jgi:hypothetical protein